MDKDVLLFGLGNQVFAYYEGLKGPIVIFNHPKKGSVIYSLRQTERGLLAGSNYDLTNIFTGETLIKRNEPITSILDYKERDLIFSGYADGEIISVDTSKVELPINDDMVGKGLRGGPGTLVVRAGDRLFLANERIYEIITKDGNISKSNIKQKTKYIGDYPKIFTWGNDMFDMTYHNDDTHPYGAELKKSLDRTLVAFFPTFGREITEYPQYATASKSGDFWYMTIHFFDKKSKKIKIYKEPNLMSKRNQRIKNPNLLLEIHSDFHLESNPAIIVEKDPLDEIIHKSMTK